MLGGVTFELGCVSRKLLRRIEALSQVGLVRGAEYCKGWFYKLDTRWHRRHIKEYKRFEMPPREALALVTKISLETVCKLEADFTDAKENIGALLGMEASADIELAKVLYVLARVAEPKTIVETGVYHGVSSFFILSALKGSEGGSLTSIDLPPLDPQVRVEIGKAVPEDLRDKWTLYLGSSSHLLPGVLKRVGTVGLFVHDSDHSYRNMLAEFALAWQYLAPKGCIVSDDIHLNDAFILFSRRVGSNPTVVRREKGGYLGILRKENLETSLSLGQ